MSGPQLQLESVGYWQGVCATITPLELLRHPVVVFFVGIVMGTMADFLPLARSMAPSSTMKDGP